MRKGLRRKRTESLDTKGFTTLTEPNAFCSKKVGESSFV